MTDAPGRLLFTKAVRAEPAEPTSVASPRGSLNCSNDPHGLKRLKKCQAKTPEGMMRLAGKIIENGLPQPRPEIKKPKGPKYSEQRCVTIDPNAYRAPFNRVRSPREERNRRPENWTARWFVLPKLTVEGLRTMAIQFAQAQQHSDWPGERQKYPRSANYFVTAALNDFFKKLGFEQFCVEEKSPLEKHRVWRFVAPNA
jgi:hypothetical protein